MDYYSCSTGMEPRAQEEKSRGTAHYSAAQQVLRRARTHGFPGWHTLRVVTRGLLTTEETEAGEKIRAWDLSVPSHHAASLEDMNGSVLFAILVTGCPTAGFFSGRG